MDFSKLAVLRNKKDLTQREMAKILNISKSTYARWETQEEIIPLRHLVNFCNYFKVTIDYNQIYMEKIILIITIIPKKQIKQKLVIILKLLEKNIN